MTAIDFRDGVEALSSSASPSFLSHYKGTGPDSGLDLADETNGTAELARDDAATVVFAGELFDRSAFARKGQIGQERSDAELLLAAYRELGERAFHELRGVFALAIHDRRKNTLLFARDQLGHHPFFYARGRDGIYLSESIVRLVRHPDVSSAVNRVVVAEMLIHRSRSSDETGFEAVQRVRSGWLYRLDDSGLSAARYWFPVQPGGASEWVREAELPEFDETAVQTAVARSLKLPHELVPFEEASGTGGLVTSAVRTSGTWPMPLVNLWQPAYAHLALLAQARGLRRVLTGAGGDEWLQVSPQWGFSRLRRLHVREMHHLYRTYLQSYNLKPRPLLKNLVWRYGIRYALRSAALKALDVTAPSFGRELKMRRFRETRPAWLAPDPALSAEVERRAGALRTIESDDVEFARDNFPFLENPIGAMEREEAFERGRRLGVETFMPFWDPDLDNFLARVPPHLMNQGHWSKGLVRTKLARRFPDAGFATQAKVLSTTLSTRLMYEQTPDAWRKMGGVPALRMVGIVDEKVLQSDFESRLGLIKQPEGSSGEQTLARSIAAHGIWTVLNVESWLRQWV